MKKKPAKTWKKPAVIFKPPDNPANWKPSPEQMEIYVSVCRGEQAWKVARDRNTTTFQVRELCEAIDEFLVEKHISDIRLMRMRRMMVFEELYSVAMESFATSKNPEVTLETGTTVNGKINKKRTVEQAAGDPSFLAIAKDCQASICQLWALNKKSADESGEDDAGRIAGKPLLQALEIEQQKITLRLKQLGQQ